MNIDRSQDPFGGSEDLVSILMPVFNAASTLSESVVSVLAQSYRNWELLLVDDGSSDGSLDLARQFASDHRRIRVLSLGRNSGAAYARNFGLDHANGRYIAFLDADDLWHTDKLGHQIADMKKRSAALSFTGYERVDPNGAHLEQVHAPHEVQYGALLKRNVMGCLTVMYDSEILGKVPMPLLQRQHDFALWLQLVRQTGTAYGLDENLATYRVGEGTLSANKAKAAKDIWRIFRGQERLSLVAASWYFGHYAYFGFRDRVFRRHIRKLRPSA